MEHQPDVALHWASRARDIAPSDEFCTQRLIRLLVARGNTAAAHAEYERLAAILRRDHDIEPSMQTRQLLTLAEISTLDVPTVVPVVTEGTTPHEAPHAEVETGARGPRPPRYPRVAAILVAAAVLLGAWVVHSSGDRLSIVTARGTARPTIRLADLPCPSRDTS